MFFTGFVSTSKLLMILNGFFYFQSLILSYGEELKFLKCGHDKYVFKDCVSHLTSIRRMRFIPLKFMEKRELFLAIDVKIMSLSLKYEVIYNVV
jgi:hypothetical protein